MEINVNNLPAYLSQKTGLFHSDAPIYVSELSRENNAYADGYVNFVFHVRQGERSYIVKQARRYLKTAGIVDFLPERRNYLEYMSYRLRDPLVGEFIPKILFSDHENHLFIMEDLGPLKNMRFQLCAGAQFPLFPKQIGEFLAKSHFYTSELYLSRGVYTELCRAFLNADMRGIMEDMVLMRGETSLFEDKNDPIKQVADVVWDTPGVQLELMEVRDILKKKGECLIHGDLHTSNIFLNETRMSVIDMEYSFMGPFGYDIGYLLANFISQYAAHCFQTKFDAGQSARMQTYLLDTILNTYLAYYRVFLTCFEQDGQRAYQKTEGYLPSLFTGILQDSIGFMAAANMFRIFSGVDFPDFDCIPVGENALLAKGLSIAIDEHLLRSRVRINDPYQLKREIIGVREAYFSRIAPRVI